MPSSSRWKLVLLPLALAVMLYFLAMGLLWPPAHSLLIAWDPSRRAVVQEPGRGIADASGQAVEILPGDILLAIDGQEVRFSDLYFRFGPPAPEHVYTLERDGARFNVRLESGRYTWSDALLPSLTALGALAAWVVGGLILYFARDRREDEDARAVGRTSLACAVALGAAMSISVGVPGSRLADELLLPLISLGLFEVSFVPGLGTSAPGRDRIFRLLRALVGISWAATVVEIFVLNPGISLADLSPVNPGLVRLGVFGLAILALPINTVRRLWAAAPRQRRPLIILLTGMVLALLPLATLSILPDLFGDPLLPYEVATASLILLPAAYGLVIYRHRYLGLDVFLTRALTALIVAVVTASLYGIGASLAREMLTASLEPVIGASFMLVGFVALGVGRGRLQSGVEFLLSGPDRQYPALLASVSRLLAGDPRPETLRSVLLDVVPQTVDVRQAGLWLVDEADTLEQIGSLRVETPSTLNPTLLPESLLLRTRFPDAPLFGLLPWAMGAFPLVIHGEAIGLWALGPKHPDLPFDAREVEFLAAVANAGAVAADNMRLFEALREMSQNLMQAAASERRALASRIHDDPLQLVARMVDDLSGAMRELPPGSALSVTLSGVLRDLKTLARELRDICAGIRPPILGQGLQFTLRELVRSFERDHSIPASLEIRCDPEADLPDRALDAVYHVVTEALNNVAKHANARRVTLTAEQMGDGLRISVADDGRTNGLPSASLGELVRRHHFGLAGMFNQAEGAGGRLEIEHSGAGTRVRLTLPLSESKRE